jgi:hypothetical protein
VDKCSNSGEFDMRREDKVVEHKKVPRHMKKHKVNRMWVVRQLCLKKFGAKRPTAIQINEVILEWGLNRYIGGKKRSKEEITKNIQKAYAFLS